MVADHHIGFATIQIPKGQTPVLIIKCKKRFHHIVSPLRFGISKQRMRGTVGIPQ